MLRIQRRRIYIVKHERKTFARSAYPIVTRHEQSTLYMSCVIYYLSIIDNSFLTAWLFFMQLRFRRGMPQLSAYFLGTEFL